MPCGTRVIWDPAPGDCTFKIQASGDEHLFNVSASVSVNGASRPPLRHDDIVHGASFDIGGKGQRWVIKPTVVLTADPDQPVVLRAWLENPDGSIVKIPDFDGGQIEARCEWDVDEAATSPLMIKISVSS